MDKEQTNSDNSQYGEKKEVDYKDRQAYYKAVTPLKTFAGDIAESVKKKGASQVSIRLEEDKKKPNKISYLEEEPQYLKKIFIVITSLILLSGIIWLGSKSYYAYKGTEYKEKPELDIKTLIKGDIIKTVDISRKNRVEIVEIIKKTLQNIPQSQEKIVIIAPVAKTPVTELEAVNSNKLLEILTPNIPQQLLRSFSPIMTLGYRSTEEKFSPFLILKTDSFNSAFSGMLEWEKNIAVDLADIIMSDVNETTGVFIDMIVRNKDLRVLKDIKNDVVLAYSFIDAGTLVITSDLETLRSVLDKLLLSGLKR